MDLIEQSTHKWSWITEFMDHMLPGSLVYDIGCGNGRNMTYPGINFIGVDACDRLAEARHKKRIEREERLHVEHPIAKCYSRLYNMRCSFSSPEYFGKMYLMKVYVKGR